MEELIKRLEVLQEDVEKLIDENQSEAHEANYCYIRLRVLQALNLAKQVR
jgi:hypothetical protein